MVYHYNHIFYLDKNSYVYDNKEIFFEKFVKRLKDNTNFEELITHRGISSELIFHKILSKITKRLDYFINEYNNSKKVVNLICRFLNSSI